MSNKQISIATIASDCISRWGEDSKTKDFCFKLNEFIAQLEDQNEIKDILIELVKNYNYYSREKINIIFHDFYIQIEKKFSENTASTIYSIIEDKQKINSSSSLLEEFRLLNSISSDYGYFLDDLSLEDLDNIENIIFFDDIIGSGKTIKTFFEDNKLKLQKVKCYIYCIEILNPAIIYLNSFFEKNNIECDIVAYNIQDKVFENSLIFGSDAKKKEEALRIFEETVLWKKGNPNVLGFDNSQAIVSFFRNTPNNTISSFWCSKNEWKALFPRNNEKPDFIKMRRSNIKSNLKKDKKGPTNDSK